MAVTEAAFRASILPFTLAREGGLSLDRKDPGNWTGGKVGVGKLHGTKFGIAASTHPTLDIRHLTLAQAQAIYWTEYCVRPGFDHLSLPLALVVFDAGVNCGPARARVWLAGAAVHAGDLAQVRAVSAANLAYHRRLKTWSRYGKGWAARIAACEQRALALLTAAPVAVPAVEKAPTVETARATPRAAVQPVADPVTLFFRGLFAVLGARPQLQGA